MMHASQDGSDAGTSPISAGRVIEISFAPFTARITIRSERELTVDIVAGDNFGFTDTVPYEAVAVRDALVLLSWQEHNSSTIVHVLDFSTGIAHTAVTPGTGGFMRSVASTSSLAPDQRISP
jgi:hypothetical protein